MRAYKGHGPDQIQIAGMNSVQGWHSNFDCREDA